MTTECKLLVGSISYLKRGMKHFDKRVAYHEEQLRFWEQFDADFHYCRAEIAWDEPTRQRLQTSMNITSIPGDAPCPPGKSRNLLLKFFYNSDYDYLICCDDDQVLDPGLEGFDFLKTLPVKLAAEGALITFQNETWLTKAKLREVFELRKHPAFSKKHILEKAICTGNMQISCIPNLVKYGYEPLFFDEDTMAQEGEIPEDAKFQVDWLLAAHPVYLCKTLFNTALDNYIKSSIYKSGRYRYMTNHSRIEVLNRYIQNKIPRRPDIQTLDDLSKHKNSARPCVIWGKNCAGVFRNQEALVKRATKR